MKFSICGNKKEKKHVFFSNLFRYNIWFKLGNEHIVCSLL